MTPRSHESPWDGPGSEDLRLTPIRDAVSSLLRARGLGETEMLARVESVWQEVAGPEVAARVQPVGLRGGELICEVADAVWATEMRLLSEHVLNRLAEVLGEPPADRLSLRVRRRSGA